MVEKSERRQKVEEAPWYGNWMGRNLRRRDDESDEHSRRGRYSIQRKRHSRTEPDERKARRKSLGAVIKGWISDRVLGT